MAKLLLVGSGIKPFGSLRKKRDICSCFDASTPHRQWPSSVMVPGVITFRASHLACQHCRRLPLTSCPNREGPEPAADSWKDRLSWEPTFLLVERYTSTKCGLSSFHLPFAWNHSVIILILVLTILFLYWLIKRHYPGLWSIIMNCNSHSEPGLNKLWANTISVSEHNFAMNKTICNWATTASPQSGLRSPPCRLQVECTNSCIFKQSTGVRRKIRSLSMGTSSLIFLW